MGARPARRAAASLRIAALAAALVACSGAPPGKAPIVAAGPPSKARWQEAIKQWVDTDDPRRPSTDAESLRVADLPVLIEEPIPIDPPPTTGPIAADVEVAHYDPVFVEQGSARTVSVKLMAPGFGQFRGFDAQYTFFDCDSKLEPPRFSLRWDTLVTRPATAVEFAITDGWLEKSSCSVYVQHRSAVRPRAAAHGLILAYRACRETCAGSTVLTFLTPALEALARDGIGGEVTNQTDKYTNLTVSVRRGEAVSLLASVALDAAAAWIGDDEAAKLSPKEIVVGIDVAQVVGDAEPTVLVYVQ